MAIFDIFRRRPAAAQGGRRVFAQSGGVLIAGPDQLAEYLRSGAETQSGVVVTPETAMRVAAVFRCVSLIAGAVANMPLAIKRRVDARSRVDADDTAVWRLLRRRPNSWQTPSQFRRMMQSHVLLRGNAYAVIARAGGQPVSLVPLHPDRVKVTQLPDLTLAYTVTRMDGSTVVMPQGEIMHVVGLTLDGVTGVSPVQYARETIGLSLSAERHGAQTFRNGTLIGGVFSVDAKLSDEAYGRLKESLDSFAAGGENAARNLIAEQGAKYEPLGMTAEDIQYIETRKLTRSDIAMFYGVPPHMLGDTEKSTSWGSGIEQQHMGFVAYTLEDWLTAWEESVNRDLIADPRSDLYARFNRAALVRGDIKTRFDAYKVGREGGWLSANDVRELEDMNPIDGGDEYIVPLNMRPAGESGAEGLQ